MEKNYKELQDIFHNYPSQNLPDPKDGLSAIRDKLYTILRSPMRDEYSREAFKWVCQLTITTKGFSWICPNESWSDPDEIKMFLLVSRLSLTEIELVLPYLQRHILEGEEPEVEEGKVIARSASLDDYDTFGNHLIIIEHLIHYLIKQDDKAETGANDSAASNSLMTKMIETDLRNLLDHLKKTIQLLLNFLETAHKHWDRLTRPGVMKNEQHAAIIGTMRLIAIWIAEDPPGFIDDCSRFFIDFMVDMILVGNNHIKDILITAVHSLIIQQDTIQDIKKQPKLKMALQKYLDHISGNEDKANSVKDHRKQSKLYKLRCGMIRDILEVVDR